MADLTLCIGSKNASSWSMRAWLALSHAGVGFEEVLIPLGGQGSRERILAYSPSGRVPVLRHGELIVWDSLAICEYLHELFPDAGLWPQDRAARAIGRAISAEVHAEFVAMRAAMPLDIRLRAPVRTWPAPVQADIDRVLTLWKNCRQRFSHKGPLLLGDFSIADAMYAPMVMRFLSHDIAVDRTLRAYMDAVVADPYVQQWVAAANVEEPGLAQED